MTLIWVLDMLMNPAELLVSAAIFLWEWRSDIQGTASVRGPWKSPTGLHLEVIAVA